MKLLLVDDDDTFREVLAKALEKRGYEVSSTANIDEAKTVANETKPGFAIVDLKIADESGLSLIPDLCKISPGIRIVMLTGYASINTAVDAIKLGAINYLTKPADTDEIIEMFKQENKSSEEAKPLQQVEWNHIEEVLHACNGNITQAAEKLGMHRRTLQRKLKKRPF